ncbi:endolytic transglycosylase MltG [Streptomyces sp. SB3404]|uniref:Endolytic transglycosylase MltG n=2 Tax=Streptomyces boncukensis TaxID=2711219 RepID=A0A6G4X6H0_9ACTN|nr:endolytic transglycosylase MltG [Streptomyces boncukensis]
MRKLWLVGVALVCALAVTAALVLLLKRHGEENRTLEIPEGWRAAQVYDAVDRALDKPEGTTERAAERAAKKGVLKLPAEAKGNPEGYLASATYSLEDRTPTSLLTAMVNTADKRLARDGITRYSTVTVASIAQAEADTPEDMGKVARVVANRRAQGMPLQMDSTINYALKRSTLNTTIEDTRINSPYNTYRHKGLPPSPINTPGLHARRAAADPPPGDWLYFVTVGPGDTRFTDDYEQHKKWVAEFNENQRNQ